MQACCMKVCGMRDHFLRCTRCSWLSAGWDQPSVTNLVLPVVHEDLGLFLYHHSQELVSVFAKKVITITTMPLLAHLSSFWY